MLRKAFYRAARLTGLALSLLLASFWHSEAQTANQAPPGAIPEQTLPFPAIDCGLNVRVSGHRIADGCLQSALNVKFNLDGTIHRRDGYGQCNATALPTGASTRRLYEFDAADGTKYLVAFSSSSVYKAGTDCNFSVITGLQNLSLTLNTACTQALGRLWCVNQTDGLFSWDGTSTQTVVGAPNGTLIDNYANRILIGNVAGSQSQLYVSGYLDGTNWTTSNKSTSPAIIPVSGVNDGKNITCLMGAYQSTYILAQERKLYGLYGTDNSNFVMRELSNEVGCIEPFSIQQYDNKLVWMSQRGVEQMSGPNIDWRGSDPVYPILQNIVSAKGNSRSATDNTQSDFQAGNLCASGSNSCMSATISPGNVVPSSWSVVDSTAGDWGNGTFSNTTSSHPYTSITLLVSTINATLVNPTWTFGTGTNNFSNTSTTYSYTYKNAGNATGYQYTSTTSLVYGSWSALMTVRNFSGSPSNYNYSQQDFVFISDTSTFSVVNGYTLLLDGNTSNHTANVILQKLTNGSRTTLGSGSASSNGSGAYDFSYQYVFNIYRDAVNGQFTVSWGTNSFTGSDSTFSSTNSFIISNVYAHAGGSNHDTPASSLSAIILPTQYYVPSGTFTSKAWDTGLSTPTWGPFNVSMSSASDAPITFQVQSSSNGIDTFQTLVNQTVGSVVAAGQKRYLRYVARFSTTNSTKTATLSEVDLSAETTGYFISQCRQPSASISSWGLLQCNTKPNGGALSFWVSTGTTCGAVTDPIGANWQSQINNSSILVETATAVAYRAYFSIGSATDVPTMQDCTISWNEGNSRPLVASGVFEHVYHIFYTTATSGTVGNDHVLTLDQFGRWSLWDDVPGATAVFYNRQLVIGDSGATGLAYTLYTGNTDNGNAFTSNFRTRDFDLGNWRSRKQFGPLYLELDPAQDQASAVSLTVNGIVDINNTTILGPASTAEGTGLVVARFPWAIESQSQGRYISIDVSNTGTQPWKLYRGALRYRVIREE